jgi:ParB/RepB/Spo0J family partition protein
MTHPSVKQVFDIVDPKTLVRNRQVREDRDEAKDAELQESIAMYGVLLPIVVHMVEGAYHVIDGHRRTEMAIAADQLQVPVYIRPTDHRGEITALQLVANIAGRSDMTLKDQANGVRALYEGDAGQSATLVADMLGKSRSWVSKMLMVTKPSSTYARKLLASEKLSDLEVAYMLCQIEELDSTEAELLYKEYEHVTRDSLKAVLDRLKRSNDGVDSKKMAEDAARLAPHASDEQLTLPGVEPGGTAEKSNEYAIEFDRDDLILLKSILADAVVHPGALKRLAALRTVVADSLAE